MILTNAKIYLAGYDLTGDFNQVALAFAAEELDDTAFGDTTRSRTGGLKTAAVEGSGFWNGGADVDKQIFDRIGTADVPMLIGVDGADAGEVSYFLQALEASYQLGGAVGELLPFNLSAVASGGHPLVRGTVLHNGAITSTTSGTAYQVGAVAAGKKLFAALFIIGDPAGTNPTLDLKIQSDNAENMATPTDRITFAQRTARSALFATPVNGAITDDWWRATWTIGGTDSPSFATAVIMGIL